MLAFATPPLGTPLPPAPEAGQPHGSAPIPLSFVRSVMPALDRTFGLDRESPFPADIAELVERLRAGPLGRSPSGSVD